MRIFRNGNATRRCLLQAGLVAAGGVIGARKLSADDAAPAREQAQKEKLSQEAVQYQPMPKDAKKYGPRCATCTFFQSPNVCAIVAGPVSSQGWCTAYALLHE